MKKVLFVCTGNTCRSPMAEALFRLRMGKDETEWIADSAGLFAADGEEASANAITAMAELGVDLSTHRSKPLTAKEAEEADWIIPMTHGHLQQINARFPELEQRVCLINSFGTSKVAGDISDPFGGSLGIYQKTRDEIDRAISDLILFLRKNHS